MASPKLLPGGFPEQNIVSQRRENIIKELITNTFEAYGFVNIETPAVEAIDVLTAKGGDEVSKQVFGLYGLAQGAEDTKSYALHFDLTVPLARYVIDHENELKMPFKRYQIQKVWRGERQQKGRFKEFYQCDVDVIDRDLDVYYDAEVIEVLNKTLKAIFQKLELDQKIIVKLNNRNLYQMLFDELHIDPELRKQVLAVVDNYYKYKSVEDYQSDIQKLLGDQTLDFVSLLEKITKACKTGEIDSEIQSYKEHIEHTRYILGILEKAEVEATFDPYIVRGLDYYDGSVFETFIQDHESVGSICSGGRYTNLVGDIRERTGKKGENYGGVGGSIGLSRLLYVIEQEGFLKKEFPLTDMIIFNVDEKNSTEKPRLEIAKRIRALNISVDHYIKSDKLAKQFGYAESKNIPFGIFLEKSFADDQEVKIRNLATRQDYFVHIDNLEAELPDILKA